MTKEEQAILDARAHLGAALTLCSPDLMKKEYIPLLIERLGSDFDHNPNTMLYKAVMRVQGMLNDAMNPCMKEAEAARRERDEQSIKPVPDNLEQFKWAWSPWYQRPVKIIKVRNDERGEKLIDTTMNDKPMLFRPVELTKYTTRDEW